MPSPLPHNSCSFSLRAKGPEDSSQIVVFRIRSRDARCDECGEQIHPGDLLRKEQDRALCLECADLGDLVFLPSGDPAITRRASRYSRLRAVVVQWSRTRKRYERQGTLVEPQALARAEEESLGDAELRERRRLRAAERRTELDAEYIAQFARSVRQRYPALPSEMERSIAEHACRKYSGRVGRSAAAKRFDPKIIDLAVAAKIRHDQTPYDELLARGYERGEARAAVRFTIDRIIAQWRGQRNE